MNCLTRKSLLYKSKVDYGGWTINHIVGCTHGCTFPCYAFMMAKRFGWVKDYEDWRKPRLVENALELLDEELSKLKEKVEVVHLCFTTDPFMYDSTTGKSIPEITEMTLKIIKRLNQEGIRLTTLTKGLVPEELLNDGYSKDNEYGITLVSLNEDFRKRFEPFSARYKDRISALKKLSDAGCKTWISMEPYTTPNLDETAGEIENLLAEISFVDKIIFGKINYNVKSTTFTKDENFYPEISNVVSDFCESHDIQCHIKTGTPGHKNKTNHILQG